MAMTSNKTTVATCTARLLAQLDVEPPVIVAASLPPALEPLREPSREPPREASREPARDAENAVREDCNLESVSF